MSQPSLVPSTDCDCMVLGSLDPVFREHRTASGQLVALTDEGMLCVVDSWPHDCSMKACLGHAWTDAEWSSFLEGFAAHGSWHHVTADGRAVIPVVEDDLLWGAIVVDPGTGCPDRIALAIQPHVRTLAHVVRMHSE